MGFGGLGLGFGVWGWGFRVWGVGFGVQGTTFSLELLLPAAESAEAILQGLRFRVPKAALRSRRAGTSLCKRV